MSGTAGVVSPQCVPSACPVMIPTTDSLSLLTIESSPHHVPSAIRSSYPLWAVPSASPRMVFSQDGQTGCAARPQRVETRGVRWSVRRSVATMRERRWRPVSPSWHDANGNVTGITPPGKPLHEFAYTPVDLESNYNPPDAVSRPPVRRASQ